MHVRLCCQFCVLLVFISVRYIEGTKLGPSHSKAVVCYLATYADHRPGRGNFQLKNINAELCTHVILVYVLLNRTDDSLYLLSPWPDLEVDMEEGTNNISKLKVKYPHLKVTFSVGGWLDGSVKYSEMAANSTKRSRFVNHTLAFIKQHGFDGMDIDWEFPSKRGGNRYDKQNFVELVKDLRNAYDDHHLLLTATLDSSKDTIDYGYDLIELSKYLDYMHVACYNFHGQWSYTIGHNAPLYASDLINTGYVIDYMIKLNADVSKIVMGVPFFGRSFIAQESMDFSQKLPGLDQVFKNSTFAGPYTQEEGFLGYNEICLELMNTSSKWRIFWDDTSMVPYAISGRKLITYDNVKSMREKVKYLIENKLGGIMVWSVDTDDFRGDCHEYVDGHTDYPLLRAINLELGRFTISKIDNSSANDGIQAEPSLLSRGDRLGLNVILTLVVYFKIIIHCL